MSISQILAGAAGGALLGLGSAVLWLGTGRVAGVSGALSISVFGGEARGQRLAFVLALALVPLLMSDLWPGLLDLSHLVSVPELIVAGLLIGVGARISNGCTSGHGIAGVSVFSLRSLVAVSLFCVAGMSTVLVRHLFLGGVP
jgi:uncharacterized protein